MSQPSITVAMVAVGAILAGILVGGFWTMAAAQAPIPTVDIPGATSVLPGETVRFFHPRVVDHFPPLPHRHRRHHQPQLVRRLRFSSLSSTWARKGIADR
jgi:hypothetical protein